MVSRQYDNAADMMYRRLGRAYYELEWLTEDAVETVNRERREMLDSLPPTVQQAFHDQKPHHGPLSPGCQTCAAGTWSCLFINRVCNAPCFYCPIDKRIHGDEPPTASGLIFEDPQEYCDYIARFGFRGVGMSGGEPLLALPKVLAFLKALRDRFGEELYIWLYSNGILADEKKLGALADAGLDEIRFDISAHDYSTRAIELAVPLLPRVTVEIPMIPEDEDRLRELLPELELLGVAHLHLHQLTANEAVYSRFQDRNYTFLHHPEFAVHGSEAASLRIIAHASQHHPNLPVQFCSRPYKKQVQGNGRRFRALETATPEWLGHDTSTETGLLRRVSHPGEPNAPFKSDPDVVLSDDVELEAPLPEKLPVALAYFDPIIRARSSSSIQELPVTLEGGRTLFLAREPVQDFGVLSDGETEFLQLLTLADTSMADAMRWLEGVQEQVGERELMRMERMLSYERKRWGNGPLL